MFRAFSSLTFLLVGFLIGAFFFSDTQQRSVLAVHKCQKCLSQAELLGLLGSVAVQKTPALLPIIFESDLNIVMEHPVKKAPVHYVIIPKKDIRSPTEFTESDEPYILDAYAIMQHLVQEHDIYKYRVTVNGPGYQQVNYLHFHLTGFRTEP